MELIFSNTIGKAYYCSECSLLFIKYNKLIINHKTKLIEELLEYVYCYLSNKHIVFEIVDLTHLYGNFRLILPYLIENYYPKMKKIGLGESLYLIADDIISDNLVHRLADQNIIDTKIANGYKQALIMLKKSHQVVN